MKFKDLPIEVQNYILATALLMEKVEIWIDDELVQDYETIQQRVDVCYEKYEKMLKVLNNDSKNKI
jgi:hypothetical protein